MLPNVSGAKLQAMNIARLLVLASVFCLLPLVASAQWMWIDKDNKKVFSDQGPPSDIPEKNILRRPGAMRAAPAAAPAASTEPGASPAPQARVANAAKPTGVDKELEEKTRKAEEAEKAKKAAEEQKLAQAKSANCELAKQGKATFESGMRVARVNPKTGEREIMTDEQRAAEQQRLQSVIASDCK